MNAFGEAYVMPANDTFASIRECMGASSVTLPDAGDFAPGAECKSPKNSRNPGHRHDIPTFSKLQSRNRRSKMYASIGERTTILLHADKSWPKDLGNDKRQQLD